MGHAERFLPPKGLAVENKTQVAGPLKPERKQVKLLNKVSVLMLTLVSKVFQIKAIASIFNSCSRDTYLIAVYKGCSIFKTKHFKCFSSTCLESRLSP